MSRRTQLKLDPFAHPTRRDVDAAISHYFSSAEQNQAWEAIDKLTPQQNASKEYLQLSVIALSRGTLSTLLDLCEIGLVDPMQIHQRFISTAPFSGWSMGWWVALPKPKQIQSR